MTKTTTQLPSMTPTKGSPTVTWRQTETDPRRDPPPPQSTPPRGTSKVKQEVKLCNAVRSNWMVLLAYFWSWIQKLWRWTNLHVREYSGEGFEHIYSCSGQSKHFKPFINTYLRTLVSGQDILASLPTGYGKVLAEFAFGQGGMLTMGRRGYRFSHSILFLIKD